MKLSEAIRLGSMLRPQTTHDYFNEVGSCAMGAAYEAVRADASGVNEDDLEQMFPVLYAIATCPLCGVRHGVNGTVFDVIARLNDEHGWTREAIADWVETIEAAQEQPATPEPVAVSA